MITYSSVSKIGGREINEDCISCAVKGNSAIFTLADGVGGLDKGEIASRVVVDKAAQVFELEDDHPYLLENCLLESQNALISEQIKMGLMSEMKTTVVCLILDDFKARWGHVGDSRLYCFRKNKLLTRTIDHSVAQMLVTTGMIKENDIRFHEERNRLIRVMGTQWDSPKYDVSKELSICPDDSFLLCSDGFWEWILEKDMIKLLKRSENPQEWLLLMEKQIIATAKNSNMDNYSAIAVFVR